MITTKAYNTIVFFLHVEYFRYYRQIRFKTEISKTRFYAHGIVTTRDKSFPFKRTQINRQHVPPDAILIRQFPIVYCFCPTRSIFYLTWKTQCILFYKRIKLF